MVEPLEFGEFVDLLRQRIADSQAINPGVLPGFTVLMADYADVTPSQWYWEAFDELAAQGHLDMQASGKTMGDPPDAHATLSADGRYYLRHEADS